MQRIETWRVARCQAVLLKGVYHPNESRRDAKASQRPDQHGRKPVPRYRRLFRRRRWVCHQKLKYRNGETLPSCSTDHDRPADTASPFAHVGRKSRTNMLELCRRAAIATLKTKTTATPTADIVTSDASACCSCSSHARVEPVPLAPIIARSMATAVAREPARKNTHVTITNTKVSAQASGRGSFCPVRCHP